MVVVFELFKRVILEEQVSLTSLGNVFLF